MRILLLFVLIGSLNFTFGQEKEQPLKNLFNEFHASVNRGFGEGFFGGGVGINHVFRPEKIFALRTGLEFQFFHAWASMDHHSHYASYENEQCSYTYLSIPIVMRINIRWAFIELGANVGTGISGTRKATVTSNNDQAPATVTNIKESWNPGLLLGPVFGIGARIPLNEKLDLLVRPDAGMSFDFKENFSNFYGRLCIGIHLK